MNIQLVHETRRNLHAWVRRSRNETIHFDKRMEILMLAIADLCEALASEEPKVVDVEVEN